MNPSIFSQETANLEYSQALPEAIREQARETLRRYQQDARQGAAWPRASPYLQRILAADSVAAFQAQERERRVESQVYGQIPDEKPEDVEA